MIKRQAVGYRIEGKYIVSIRTGKIVYRVNPRLIEKTGKSHEVLLQEALDEMNTMINCWNRA